MPIYKKEMQAIVIILFVAIILIIAVWLFYNWQIAQLQ
jgi:multidrug resistance efflux pump